MYKLGAVSSYHDSKKEFLRKYFNKKSEAKSNSRLQKQEILDRKQELVDN
jgi:hypothetical protein